MPWRWYVALFLYEFFATVRDARTWLAALVVVVGVLAVWV